MVITLIKNHFKRSKPRLNNINTKNILGLILLGILSVLILGIFGYILLLLTQTFARLRLPDVYLKTVFFILLGVLTIYEVFNIIKQLYQSKDNHIYMKLPIEKEKVFLSKIIYLYLKQLAISLVFLFATAGIYGFVETDITFFYFIRLLVIALIIPFLSLILASLLSIPVSFIMGYIRKNKFLLIASITIVIGAFFIVYIQFINVVLSFIDLTSASSSPIIDPLIIENLRASTNNLYISSLFYNLLMNQSFIQSLLILVLVLGALMIGVYFLLKYFYFKALNKENERIDVEIKKEVKLNKPVIAIFKKELITLTRNPDYAFQAVVLNVLMPIFIFLTIRLTYRAGEATVGREIVPGITLLTVLVFILLTNSFQGMIISREKEAHYITKIIPVKIIHQLFAKIGFGYILNFLMTIVTITIVTSMQYINLMEGIVIFILSIIFSTGYTLTLVSSDYENPQLTSNEGGFEEGLNMYKTLFVGLFLAIIVGVVFSVTPFIRKLFLSQRVFEFFGLFVIKLDANKINYLLYGAIVLILLIYMIISIIRIRKVVNNK
ncbi:MAG TPA: hypothetical protein GX742_04135 [Acholeplasmataceae bacterium]|nr:hypothetical protein [Acholeplasmataceae bacterium]